MKRADLSSAAYVTAAGVWAEAALAGGSPPEASVRSELVEELATCFRLAPMEQRVIDLVIGVERSLAAEPGSSFWDSESPNPKPPKPR